MKQYREFMSGEGDKWHDRNKNAKLNDAVIDAILSIGGRPDHVLEIGCSDGRYLSALRKHFGRGRYIGIDPSAQAIREGNRNYPEIELIQGHADDLDFGFTSVSKFDLIIFGFCLYLVDRDSLFHIVSSADAHLRDGGYLAIHDFDPKSGFPEVVPYHHKQGLFSYKMRYENLWLANPEYWFISRTKTGDGTSIAIIKKDGWERYRY